MKYYIAIALLCLGLESQAQITDIKVMPAGECENQGMTGTCWSFSGMSFFQAELLRQGKGQGLNLSEMFVVRSLFPLKARNYVRMHGKANFGEGGEFTDDLLCLRDFGLVPQSVYDGGHTTGPYNFGSLQKQMDAVVKKAAADTGVLDPRWQTSLETVLHAGMSDAPASFDYEGKIYTPKTFAASLGLKADDYVVLTSFTHHPYNQPFVLEVPDNWNWERSYNVSLADLTEVAEQALQKGYTLAWAADISEKGFDAKKALAEVNETAITPELRQQAFDDFRTQDDHGMHIVGLAKDASGKTYFKVKNSWGSVVPAGTFFYASEAYFQYKTTNIMVNKKALPKAIAKKLGIKV